MNEKIKKILIIEEDTTFFKAYQEMFKNKGINIMNAVTGREGLTMVKTENPDLILLDVMLPGGMNGFDVLEDLKRTEATKNIPVIILTNLDSETNVAKSIGAKDYLVKANTTKDDLVKIVMDCLEAPCPEP